MGMTIFRQRETDTAPTDMPIVSYFVFPELWEKGMGSRVYCYNDYKSHESTKGGRQLRPP